MAAEKGGTAVFACCDVTKTEDLTGAFASAVKRFGRLQIAFNNTGIIDEDLFADDPGGAGEPARSALSALGIPPRQGKSPATDGVVEIF